MNTKETQKRIQEIENELAELRADLDSPKEETYEVGDTVYGRLGYTTEGAEGVIVSSPEHKNNKLNVKSYVIAVYKSGYEDCISDGKKGGLWTTPTPSWYWTKEKPSI